MAQPSPAPASRPQPPAPAPGPSPSPGPGPRPPAPAPSQAQPGARGRVVGLVSGAQYNARIGKVVDYDGDSGRYLVELDAENQLRVKRGNLLCAL